jgi:hypothetical protein
MAVDTVAATVVLVVDTAAVDMAADVANRSSQPDQAKRAT